MTRDDYEELGMTRSNYGFLRMNGMTRNDWDD